ncbi:putative btb poz domain protein [Diplodia seriata]|uniref:Putative btb poz domain protein n=1 Tax=Diplodia seriata TaxID=420778 RepID=A0A0G2GGP5_9PEZI|nr:putative btb poz domain protein [Diplodia seriata]
MTHTTKMDLLYSCLYSDLTIRCSDGRNIPAHKAVVCTQSTVLANACNPEHQFKEATSGVIDLTADEPATAMALLEYFYHHKYTVPAETTAGAFHAKVYAAGDYYQVNCLKEQAKSSFTTWLTGQLSRGSSQEDFFRAVEVIYDSTPESDRGLRDIVVEFVCNHTDIAGKKRAATDLLASTCPVFVTDLAVAFKAKATDYARLLKKATKCKHYACVSCNGKVHIDLSNFQPSHIVRCIHCGMGSRVRLWEIRVCA